MPSAGPSLSHLSTVPRSGSTRLHASISPHRGKGKGHLAHRVFIFGIPRRAALTASPRFSVALLVRAAPHRVSFLPDALPRTTTDRGVNCRVVVVAWRCLLLRHARGDEVGRA